MELCHVPSRPLGGERHGQMDKEDSTNHLGGIRRGFCIFETRNCCRLSEIHRWWLLWLTVYLFRHFGGGVSHIPRGCRSAHMSGRQSRNETIFVDSKVRYRRL